jgi:carnitine 3-dehydrogenase
MATKIEHVGIVGCGLIGTSWAAHFLAHGLHVTATDPAPGAEKNLRAGIEAAWPVLKRLGLKPGASVDHLRFEKELAAAVNDAQFVQESGPERLDVKRELFEAMDRATSPEVILSSSSSGIQVSEFQATCAHPGRAVLGHPFNPPHLIPLVEVIGGKFTAPETVSRAIEFYRAVGKSPIHIRKELKGHVANRMQAALWQEAIHLVLIDAISVEDLDTAISQGPGLRWALLGPFLNLHLSGGAGGLQHFLEHIGPPTENWWNDLGRVHLTPEINAKLVAGTNAELAPYNLSKLVAARDEILVKLLALKAETPDLP